MDQPVIGRLVDSVFTSLKTSGTSAKHWKSLLSFSFPIRLSLYTLLLPPVALFSMVWNRKRAFEIWQKTTAAFNPAGIPVLLDVAGRNNE